MQTLPLVDLQAQYAEIHDEVHDAMQVVLDSAGFIMGPQVAAFEREFATWCGATRCVGVSSGTAALELVLRSLDVGPGAEVITVAHTFIATAEAVSAVGATPVFVDIDPHTYNMDPNALAAAISPRTQAIMPVHLYGQPADMSAINAVAARHGLPVIEDAAQAHGATWDGVRAGSLGHAACFSFYPGKNLGAYGDAGAVVTNDEPLAEQVCLLRNHGRRSKYEHEVIGFGHRIDTLQAAILSVKLRHLDAWTAARRARAAAYSRELDGLDLMLPRVASQADPAWHLYVILTEARDALAEHLKHAGIETGVHYPLPLHLQPAYAALGYKAGALPVTERVAKTCLSLPLYPEMTDAQQMRVVAAVYDFFGRSHTRVSFEDITPAAAHAGAQRG